MRLFRSAGKKQPEKPETPDIANILDEATLTIVKLHRELRAVRAENRAIYAEMEALRRQVMHN